MSELGIDFESYSEVDIRDVGAWAYATHPSTEIICIAFWIEGHELYPNDRPRIWYPETENFPIDEQAELDALFQSIKDADRVSAWNTGFEYALWNGLCVPKMGWDEIPLEKWKDTAAVSMALTYPRALEAASKALGLPSDKAKDKEGKKLIRELCKPRKPTKNDPSTRRTPDTHPEKFQKFYDYCVQDVIAERECLKALPLQDLKGKETAIWRHTMVMNERGVPIDYELVKKIIEFYEQSCDEWKAEFMEATDFEVLTVDQVAKLKEWVISKGFEAEGMTAPIVTAIAEEATERGVLEVNTAMTARILLGMKSPKKLYSIRDRICSDLTVKDNLVYHGATTGRFAGAGLQVHNLSSKTFHDDDDLSATVTEIVADDLFTMPLELHETLYGHIQKSAGILIRPCIKAPEGKVLISADYPSIENRVISWLADDFETLRLFENGLDQYKDMASFLYGIGYHEVTSRQRKEGKQIILGCQYGMGYKTFIKTCEAYGNPVTKEVAEQSVKAYRDRYSQVKFMWYDLMNKCVEAIKNPGKNIRQSRFLSAFYTRGCLWLKLPSGRLLCYPEAEVEEGRFGNECFSHKTVDSKTRQWVRRTVIPGRLTENAVQAVARDFLCEAVLDLEDAGIPLIMHVHDEFLAMVDADEGEAKLKEFEKVVNKLPEWATGFPLTIDGELVQRFKK